MIVMKFGGTSVESAEAIERVSKIVGSRVKQSPLVVVSAMAKVTDQLVAMGNTAAAGDCSEALASVEALRERLVLAQCETAPAGRRIETNQRAMRWLVQRIDARQT